MRMTSIKMKRILDERLDNENYHRSYNRDKDTYRVEWKDTHKGMSVRLPSVIAKYNERGEVAIDELVEHVTEALRIMNEEHELGAAERCRDSSFLSRPE